MVEIQNVVFIIQIIILEKAVMLVSQDLSKSLYLAVANDSQTTLFWQNITLTSHTSLLEMDLKSFFKEQHNISNVKVLGIPTSPETCHN